MQTKVVVKFIFDTVQGPKVNLWKALLRPSRAKSELVGAIFTLLSVSEMNSILYIATKETF